MDIATFVIYMVTTIDHDRDIGHFTPHHVNNNSHSIALYCTVTIESQ